MTVYVVFDIVLYVIFMYVYVRTYTLFFGVFSTLILCSLRSCTLRFAVYVTVVYVFVVYVVYMLCT